MNLITIDFETYYDAEYSLSKMSTEDYVTDPRFEIIGVGVKINDAPTKWFSGTKDQTKSWLRGMGVFDAALIAHNGKFDFLILQVHFGRLPPMMFCTMAMAQAFLRPFTHSVSLANCAEFLDLPGRKGTYVGNMMGRHRQSLSKTELAEYGDYCINDCDLEKALFDRLVPRFPRSELKVIDMTLRMYLEPKLLLDASVLAENLQNVRALKAAAMAQLPATITPDVLRSNTKFAGLLKDRYDIDVPTKVSPTTGLSTFALAKTDTGWKELEESYADDPEISAILMARLGAKSSIEETRSERLLQIANRHGALRIPLKYYAAHTGRYGGEEKINAQNLPNIRRSRMRFGIVAPPGHVVLAADLAQIEARLTAVLARATPLIEAFAQGRDVYSEFASRVFKKQVTKADVQQRFVGKTCILGLGFGMGEVVLRSTLRKDGLKFDLIECGRMVSTYRQTYPQIPALWKRVDALIPVLIGPELSYGKEGPVTFGLSHIALPNDMLLLYSKIHYEAQGTMGQPQAVYSFGHERRKVWGGKLTENIVQALARIIIMDNALTIRQQLGISPALQQHDELDYVVPEGRAEEYKEAMQKIMVIPPTWMPNLPLAVEINYGPSLGDCK